MGVQIIKSPSGEEMVVLSFREYTALRARAGDEDAEDIMTELIVEERKNDERLTPEETQAVFDRIKSRSKSMAAE